MKSYAVSESETDQGYVRHHENKDQYGFYYIYLVIIATSVSVLLTFRLCSRKSRDLIDKIVQMIVESILAVSPKAQPSPKMNIIDVEIKNTADDDVESNNTATNAASSEESDKYLTIVSRREYIAMYALLVIAFTAYDTTFNNAKKSQNQTGIETAKRFYFPIPVQIIYSTLFSIICIILHGIQCMICNKCNRREIKQHCLEHWEEWAAIPFITVLLNYVIVHVFWILLLLVSFPVLVALKGIFLIPLSLPVILVFQRIFSCFKIICCRRRCHQVSFKDFITYFYAAIYILLFWVPVLILLYHFSKYLLNASEISNDPLKLIIILAGVIFVTYRLAKIMGHEFFLKREAKETCKYQRKQITLISTDNNNYNTV